MARNPVRWFEIHVQDMKRARVFYEAVFKVKLQEMGGPGREMWGFPGDRTQFGTAGALVKAEGVPSGGNSVVVYFGCEDCAVEEKLAAEHGGKVEQEKMSIGKFGAISLVCDTEGNLIGLHSM
jgi:predicted enzyme related to lactoylglutathione lyase